MIDTETGDLLAWARSSRTSMAREEAAVMVREVLSKIFSGKRD